MTRTFSKILELSLKHDYYTNGLCPDFDITPTASTKEMLKRLRCMFRPTTNGFFLYCDDIAAEIMPQLLAKGNTRLSFIMKLKNTNFLNFTVIPPRSDSKDIYYLYSSRTSQNEEPASEESVIENLDIKTVALHPPVFTYTFKTTANTANLQVKDPESIIRINETCTANIASSEETDPEDDTRQYSTTINLEKYPSGLYQFIISPQPENGGDETTEEIKDIYIAAQSPGNTIFSLIEITLPADFDPEAGTTYQYPFKAKFSLWEYHLLFSKDCKGYTFEIGGILQGIETNEEGVIIETEATEERGNRRRARDDDDDEEVKKNLIFTEADSDTEYVKGNSSIFIANYEYETGLFIPVYIPYREATRKDIELVIKKKDKATYTALPNPSVNSPKPIVYITI